MPAGLCSQLDANDRHRRRRLRVGIISSVGGHLAEVRELAPVLAGCDLFCVLNDAAPWQDQPLSARSYRIVHAERDARLLINLAEAGRILLRERPDVLISAGASPAVPFFLVGRLLGAATVFLESFAAVETPTLTGRLVYPLSQHFFVQWPKLLAQFPKARYAGPVFVPRPIPAPKQPGETPAPTVFVTVGSSPRPCRRLLDWLDSLAASGALPGPVLVQSNAEHPHPRAYKTVPFLPAQELDRYLRDADIVICHGGAGILGACLKWGRHPIVVPRRASQGEAVNDHQLMLCRALAERGLITVCDRQEELAAALRLRPAASAQATAPLPLLDGLGDAIAGILRKTAEARGLCAG